jgi:hypothetical protein
MRRLKRSTALLQRSRDRLRLPSVAQRAQFYQNKIGRALRQFSRAGRRRFSSVSGEKLALACSCVRAGQRTLDSWQVRLAHSEDGFRAIRVRPLRSTFALLLRNGPYAQSCKGDS